MELAIAASVEHCVRERINIIQLVTVLINSTDMLQQPYVRTQKQYVRTQLAIAMKTIVRNPDSKKQKKTKFSRQK